MIMFYLVLNYLFALKSSLTRCSSCQDLLEILPLYGDWPLQVHCHGICLQRGFSGVIVYHDG